MSSDLNNSHVVFPSDTCCCYSCLGVFQFKDLPPHIGNCIPQITQKDREKRAKQFKSLNPEQRYRLTGVKYNECGCSHVFVCGFCADDPNKTEKPHLIQHINIHWGKCAGAKAERMRAKNNKLIVQLANGDTTCLAAAAATPQKGDKKRPASTGATNNFAKAASKKHKQEQTKIKATSLKRIPKNKTSKKTLCFFMTFPSSPESATSSDRDLLRLKKIEELYKESELKAYTVSLQKGSEERHELMDLARPSECNNYYYKRHCFDQISFDWVNMPDAYVRGRNINLLELLRTIALEGTINPAGGAVYLPFRLFYYFAVAGNEAELKRYYQIDFIDKNVAEKENHLYQGTAEVGEKVLDSDDCVQNHGINGIKGMPDIQGVYPKTVIDHFMILKATLANHQDICMIRLRVLPKATIEENLKQRIKTEKKFAP